MHGLVVRLLALVLALAAAPALGTTTAAGSVAPRAGTSGGEIRTLTGALERFALTRRSGTDRVVWRLHAGGVDYRLRPHGVRLVPLSRSRVTGTVTQTPTGPVLDVRSATFLEPLPAGTTRSFARGTKVTRTLVMRVYWRSAPPARPTTAVTKDRILTQAASWFRTVSGGRYTISGSVTPWLKISAPPSCLSGYTRVMEQALARAKAKGYSPTAFGRWIVYLPCNAGGVTGLGSKPGKKIWLFGTTDLGTNVHEQGHNLGLGHANLRSCRVGTTTVTWSSSCRVHEYADWGDAMGNGPAVHFSALNKRRLGWLSAMTTVSGDATRRLTPSNETSAGNKAMVVRTSTRSYWVELRSGTNVDAGIPPACRGVQIRVPTSGSSSQVLDALPGNGVEFDDDGRFLYDDGSCTALPFGSSWTSPERVRITAAGDGTLGATSVKVDFNAPAPAPPAAPGPVTVDTGAPDRVTVRWSRPDDRGSLVTRYDVERPDGTIKRVTSLGGGVTTTTLTDLAPGDHPGLRVRAVNRHGAGAWATSAPYTVTTLRPAASITSPAAGASVSGEALVGFSATANATSGSPLASVQLEVDGDPDAFRSVSGASASGSLEWYTTWVPNGSYTLRLRVEDRAGRVGWSAPRTVTVANPVLVVDSPAAGTTVSGVVPVAFRVTSPGSWSFTEGSVALDGVDFPATRSGSTWTAQVDTRNAANGLRDLQVAVNDPARGWLYAYREVRVSNTMPVVTVTSPKGTVTSPLQTVTTSIDRSWPWTGFRAELDGQVVAQADAGDPLTLDLTRFSSGSHTFRVVGEYAGGQVASATGTLTLSWPARSVAWGSAAPASGATVSGTLAVPATLTPTSWSWQSVCLQVYDDGFWYDAGCADPGQPVPWETAWYPDGATQVRLVAYDSEWNTRTTAARTWTVANN